MNRMESKKDWKNDRQEAMPETWDKVAESYKTDLESGERELAEKIEGILIKKGLQPGDSLIEMGCGSGHLSLCLAQKGYRVTLVDFSRTALEKARQAFEKYGESAEFILGDLFQLDEKVPVHDFAWNSGVMEHFSDEKIMDLMRQVGRFAKKGILYLVPNSGSIAYLLMRARLMADGKWPYGQEYLRNDYDWILKKLGYQEVSKEYITTASVSAYQVWKAEKEQGTVSRLYKVLAQEQVLPQEEGYLAVYYVPAAKYVPNFHKESDPSEPCVEKTEKEEPMREQAFVHSAARETQLFDLASVKAGYEEMKEHAAGIAFKLQESETEREKLVQEHMELKKEHTKLVQEQKRFFDEQIKSGQEQERWQEKARQLFLEKNTLEDQLQQLQKEFQEELGVLQESKGRILKALSQKDACITQVQALCISYASAKLSRLNHLLIRLHVQCLRGSREERKAFFKWLKGKAAGTNYGTADVCRFNPWMDVHKRLAEALACTQGCLEEHTGSLKSQGRHGEWENKNIGGKQEHADSESKDKANRNQGTKNQEMIHQEYNLPDKTKAILEQPYTNYDVLIFSVIDYDFRHQRPQHFARKFAENGHRVFYINANFTSPSSVRKKQENLYLVHLNNQKTGNIYAADWRKNPAWLYQALDALLGRYAVRDAVAIVDYPNWVAGAKYLREKYGFRIVTDYMDDYTGFTATAEPFLKENCEELLRASDMVVASSSFLYDIAKRFADESRIYLIRNGTETAHFQQALAFQNAKQKKTVGYYGAVAHWFAYEKVCYVADALPDCEVVIIGEVTAHRHALEKRKNIRLLGEMDYEKLPEHLAYFDVCLIPFDTGTDLIRATNPVKFYEYLSAGKKIVATEIPELRPYRDTYVYMSNDNEKFLEYVKLCLEQKDTLMPAQACMEFAKQNDWQERFVSFAAACREQAPKASVIVLTYNNEAINRQCIESILTKTAYPDYELIIVDNASTDGTRAYLQELDAQHRQNVRIILNDKNLGFAGGNNCGIKAALGEYVILLNNDTCVTRGWITSLAKHLENNRAYAMCNPVTNSIGNESKIEAHYQNAAQLHQFAYCYTKAHMGEEYHRVDRLPLFATAIRKSVLEEVGLLDEAYKVGMFEDDDFTEKVLCAGYRIVIAEDAFVHHMQRASFQKLDDEEYQRIFEENKKIFERKWKKEWRMPRYRDGVDAGTSQGCGIE